MDPMCRILLEKAYEAVIDAGKSVTNSSVFKKVKLKIHLSLRRVKLILIRIRQKGLKTKPFRYKDFKKITAGTKQLFKLVRIVSNCLSVYRH